MCKCFNISIDALVSKFSAKIVQFSEDGKFFQDFIVTGYNKNYELREFNKLTVNKLSENEGFIIKTRMLMPFVNIRVIRSDEPEIRRQLRCP